MSAVLAHIRKLRAAVWRDSLRARLLTGAFWALIGTALSQGLLLASSIVVARLLGKTAFGELGIIRTTVGMFAALAGLRLGLTASKHVAQFRNTDPAQAGRILGLSLVTATAAAAVATAVLAALSPYVATHVIRAPHLAPALTLGCALLFFNILVGAQTGALSGFEAFKTIAIVNLIYGVLGLPLMIAGAYLWRIPGVVGGMAASAAAACLVNHVALKHEARKAGVRLAYRGVRRELSILWRFSLPAFLSGAIVGPVMWAASAMLVRQPGGYAEMGVFDAAQRWGRMLLMVPALLSTVVVPVLSERLGANDRGEARKTLMIGTLANAALVVPVALVLTIASPWAMGLFGADFVPGWPVLILVLAAVVLAALQTPAAQLLVATGRMWTGAAMNLGWALALLGACSVLLARGWGALGIAVAYLLSYAVHSVWVFLFLYRLLGRQVPDAGLKTHAGVEAKGIDDRVERKPYTGTAVARS